MPYFGPWDDPDGTLNKYLDQQANLGAAGENRCNGSPSAVASTEHLEARKGRCSRSGSWSKTFLRPTSSLSRFHPAWRRR
jgi:hypothetical protein